MKSNPAHAATRLLEKITFSSSTIRTRKWCSSKRGETRVGAVSAGARVSSPTARTRSQSKRPPTSRSDICAPKQAWSAMASKSWTRRSSPWCRSERPCSLDSRSAAQLLIGCFLSMMPRALATDWAWWRSLRRARRIRSRVARGEASPLDLPLDSELIVSWLYKTPCGIFNKLDEALKLKFVYFESQAYSVQKIKELNGEEGF